MFRAKVSDFNDNVQENFRSIPCSAIGADMLACDCLQVSERKVDIRFKNPITYEPVKVQAAGINYIYFN
jgi:hypothetical protein